MLTRLKSRLASAIPLRRTAKPAKTKYLPATLHSRKTGSSNLTLISLLQTKHRSLAVSRYLDNSARKLGRETASCAINKNNHGRQYETNAQGQLRLSRLVTRLLIRH